MSTTHIKTITVELSQSDAGYVLHALRELKQALRAKLEADEEEERTHVYADDIMNAAAIHEKIASVAVAAFGSRVLEFSDEEI
jgi:hypothetical protein